MPKPNKITDKYLKVYDNEGREIEMEKDYNVKSSKHLNLKSDLLLFSSQVDDRLSSLDGVLFAIALISAAVLGYLQKSWINGIGLGVFFIIVVSSVSVVIESFVIKKMFREFIVTMLADDITFDEIKIIATSKLPEKSKLLKHLFEFQRTFAKYKK